ncbi:predicted protein [Sclerotinia sclerotiorum 1980 UF-70]|uniref:Uncharacterized protein n=1 Tax=Sclerotinia sclerotiorum (strain ATCC 18683 / 1980 / Ss-1) TaxID=665079 RepID=A7E408_SCLS1|nr:predicted protein [Sclerotinia sclerotiorum 1980 UF-70]EDN90630.1 predicted protein [Sclerotinia sclerotiorum 1980 UF-70]
MEVKHNFTVYFDSPSGVFAEESLMIAPLASLPY